jgi:hypothetical protein
MPLYIHAKSRTKVCNRLAGKFTCPFTYRLSQGIRYAIAGTFTCLSIYRPRQGLRYAILGTFICPSTYSPSQELRYAVDWKGHSHASLDTDQVKD